MNLSYSNIKTDFTNTIKKSEKIRYSFAEKNA